MIVVVAVVLVGMFALCQPPSARAAPDGTTSADDTVVLPLVNRVLENEPTGVEVQWSNPATGNQGIVVVIRTVSTPPERPCREYRRTRQQPGAPVETIEGVGCRIGPALWELDEKRDPLRDQATATKEAVPAKAATPPRCPPVDPDMVVRVPCGRAASFTAFTMPAKASY